MGISLTYTIFSEYFFFSKEVTLNKLCINPVYPVEKTNFTWFSLSGILLDKAAKNLRKSHKMAENSIKFFFSFHLEYIECIKLMSNRILVSIAFSNRFLNWFSSGNAYYAMLKKTVKCTENSSLEVKQQ